MIRFLSSDRYRTLLSIIQILSQTGDKGTGKPLLIDATGDFIELTAAEKTYDCIQFNHNKVLSDIWKDLNPHAKEWWDLLDIGTKQSSELPHLPGLEDITRLVFIAQQLTSEALRDQILIILPPPMHAFHLIGMAQQGPVLIENLLEPLLNWWDNTRKSLTAVETLLRIKLPSSTKLRLSAEWRNCLELLQTTTLDRKLHRLYLAIDGQSHTTKGLMQRISVGGMNGVIPSHIILSDLDQEILHSIQTDCDQSMFWIGHETDFSQTLSKANESCDYTLESIKFVDSAECLSIFLPGVNKRDLRIQQINTSIYLFHLGQKFTLNLPKPLQEMVCQKAQMKSGWLTLHFDPQ